ncbi:MAG: ABC transporter ATP-binding protein, partial [Caldiserica bacterium]
MSDDVVIKLQDVSLKFKLQREKIPSLKEFMIKSLTRKVSYV